MKEDTTSWFCKVIGMFYIIIFFFFSHQEAKDPANY
jgi:hypothetical protein